jgi:hypothetical protein
MESKSEDRRSDGRSKIRRMDGVLEDLRKLEVKSWWMVSWRNILREAEANIRL